MKLKRLAGGVTRPGMGSSNKNPIKPEAPADGGMAKMPTTNGAVRRLDMSRVQKPVGPARPVSAVEPTRPMGAISGPTRAGGLVKMPTTGGAVRRPNASRVKKPIGMAVGGGVTKPKKDVVGSKAKAPAKKAPAKKK